ncbi:MAG: enoyl-CoA hydratase/isomerase family protein [Candidatus Eisenbacteria bacterium]
MPQSILLEFLDSVAVVTLNRPEKLNAFAEDMRAQLVSALDRVAAHADVRVLVITGAGKGFCSGGDVQHMVGLKECGAGFDALHPLLDAGRAIVTRLAAFEIPVIAAVNGVAAGAGCNLALACDVRLASSEARFGETFVRIGLHMDWGGVHHLPRAVGVPNALDLCWTGELIDAEEALRLHLVQRVWPNAEFAQRWRAYAARLAAAPQTSVRASKRALRASFARTLQQNLDAEVAAQAACWQSADAAEGLRAFIERREARFAAPALAEDRRTPSAAARRFE